MKVEESKENAIKVQSF